MVPDVSVNHLLPAYHDLGFSRGVEVGQRLCGNGTGQLSTRFDPVYSFQVKQRVKNQELEPGSLSFFFCLFMICHAKAFLFLQL